VARCALYCGFDSHLESNSGAVTRGGVVLDFMQEFGLGRR
jgi:hypothetical protein